MSRRYCSSGLHDLSLEGALRADGACRECYLAYTREYARKQRVRLRHDVNRAKIERGCAKCGYNHHAQALQFDHVVPSREQKSNKKKRGSAVQTHADLRRVLADPNIQVICANCHCIKTYVNGDFR
jgi:5-methylcytosine-specific restriction endonuclease McrA